MKERNLVYERDSKKPIYIGTDTFRALWLLAKAKSDDCFKITPDELGDEMIRARIATDNPYITKHQEEIKRLEKALIASLSKKP